MAPDGSRVRPGRGQPRSLPRRRHRARAAALALAALVAACSAPDAPATPTTAPAPQVAPTTSSPPAAPAPSTAPTAVGRPPTATPDAPPPAAPRSAIDVGSLDVGQLGPFVLGPGNGDRIVIEVRAQEGAAPTRRTIDRIAQVLDTVSGKTVVVDGPDLIADGRRVWDERSLVGVADDRAEASQGGAQVVLRLLFLRGTFKGDPSVLGAAVRRDVAGIFQDQVAAAGGLFTNPQTISDATTLHEVGHLLGLVDLVVDTGRADPSHPGHSPNRGSVMYYAVESSAVANLLGDQVPTDFDRDDLAELAAIGRR